MAQLKHVYDKPVSSHGMRVLVERLWPRGLTKEKAKIDWWERDVAPSDGPRKWYSHEPERWPDFQQRYRAELRGKKNLMRDLGNKARCGRVTFVFVAKNVQRNSIFVSRQVVDGRTGHIIEQESTSK